MTLGSRAAKKSDLQKNLKPLGNSTRNAPSTSAAWKSLQVVPLSPWHQRRLRPAARCGDASAPAARHAMGRSGTRPALAARSQQSAAAPQLCEPAAAPQAVCRAGRTQPCSPLRVVKSRVGPAPARRGRMRPGLQGPAIPAAPAGRPAIRTC